MKPVSETIALEKLHDLRSDFATRIRSDYEHRAKSCATCETPGACCLDAHFVNVHITRLEAKAIRNVIDELPARRHLRSEEIARGVTTIGPHRDELRFLANDIDLGDYGSRGQVRTTLLALKLAEVNWMKERTGEWPVILLDEVMAELDVQRRDDLLKYVGESEQVLFTTTDLNLFSPDFVEKAEVWKVHEGKIEK